MRLNILFVIFLGILGYLQYTLWFKDGHIRESMKLKKSLRTQLEINQSLKKENDALLFEIRRLHEHQDSVEEKARTELGMIKKGETYYQVVK